LNQTNAASRLYEDRRRAAFHEAGHAVLADCCPKVTLNRVTMVMRAEEPRLVGQTSFHSPDDPPGMFSTLLITCARTCNEAVVLGSAQPALTARDDMGRISELAEGLSQYHEVVRRWLTGLSLPQLSYIENLFPQLTAVQQAIITAAYQQTMILIQVNRAAVDYVSGMLMSLDVLTGSQIKNGLAAMRATEPSASFS
jgi:ATP-dependent Zn protease